MKLSSWQPSPEHTFSFCVGVASHIKHRPGGPGRTAPLRNHKALEMHLWTVKFVRPVIARYALTIVSPLSQQQCNCDPQWPASLRGELLLSITSKGSLPGSYFMPTLSRILALSSRKPKRLSWSKRILASRSERRMPCICARYVIAVTRGPRIF